MTRGHLRLALALAALWMVAMTWRIYPQFGDAIRVDGRLTTVTSYLADRCSQRVGPAAVTCLGEGGEEAQRLLRQEQAKSVLFILAPLLFYVLAWLPLRFLRERWQPPRLRPGG
ncbi:MAG TPA: hypothetical protein VLV50_13330 [Stellaceae bacterium]|nr:hypothetical protein [Stellaceae bacterium]